MEIFYSDNIDGSFCHLGQEESGHCIKVLRHRTGDMINIIDGKGTMFECRITDDSPKGASAEIIRANGNWGSHPYRLNMAVCPTKNADRYEWFAEKACETGIDIITPVIGMHSERKIFKAARIEKILVSAAKQSLKGAVPQIAEPVSVKDFILGYASRPAQGTQAQGDEDAEPLKLIAYCFEDSLHPRTSIKQALSSYKGSEVVILIGPEGDFSKEEATLALEHGFIPVHLGTSRLRTETAALTAVNAVYLRYME